MLAKATRIKLKLTGKIEIYIKQASFDLSYLVEWVRIFFASVHMTLLCR